MKTRTVTIFCILALAGAYAQTPSPEPRDWTLPTSLTVKQAGPQSYRFTCDYSYLDTKGHLVRRQRVSALYTRDLPEFAAAR